MQFTRTRSVFVTNILLAACMAACGSSGGNKTTTSPTTSSLSSTATSAALSSSPSSSSSSSITNSSVAANTKVDFVLPFDDATGGITQVGSLLNHAPAGKFGYVKPDAQGHFSVNGQRERFLGVNITASSAVTSHANAEKVAKRLAKFGVNLVRMHHMDNHFGAKSIIDYTSGNSRNLHAANLDNLDYFIAQLKANGIYVDLNLINSREFSAADGLPAEINQLTWKQSHVLGMVYSPFNDLEKEYAKKLLTHKNPYTQLTYAEDPAITMVEINNENGIFQQFFDGSLDKWPAVFKTPLNTQWNSWLAQKYASTALMETQWGALDQALGAEKLIDGSFTNGISKWNFEQHDTAKATATSTNLDGKDALKIAISTAGSGAWNVQLNQGAVTLTKDQIYTIKFWAKADTTRSVSVVLGQAYSPWQTYNSRNFDISTEWKEYEFPFIASATDTNARINFNGFGNQLATVYLSEVSLKPGGSLGKLPAGQTLAAKNIDNNSRNETYTQGRQTDWADFLRSIETQYWQSMKNYLQTDLKYGGMIGGTIISNSYPSAQKTLDFVDGHSYWQHPQFPSAEWDAVNWTINNISMVNDINSTLSGLAKQRVHGKPFTVTEYQHASPNNYSAEAALFAATYGALQDWDALVMFAYDANANDNWDGRYFADFFSMNAHPTKMANMLIAANLFRRGDIAAANELIKFNWSPTTELTVLTNKGSPWNVANGGHLGIPSDLPLTKRIALDVSTNPSGTDNIPAASSSATLTSDTQEVSWNRELTNKGFISINTDKTKAIYGFTDARKFTLGNVAIETYPTQFNWATIGLTLQEGSFAKPNEAAKLLIVATGDTENTNMIWSNSNHTTLGTNWGKAPTRIEVVPAKISLPFAAAKTKAWALNESGQRGAALAIKEDQGKAQLLLDGTQATLWYEVEVSP